MTSPNYTMSKALKLAREGRIEFIIDAKVGANVVAWITPNGRRTTKTIWIKLDRVLKRRKK